MEDYMVGSEEKGGVFFIGRDMLDNLFSTLKEAKEHLKLISKSTYKPVKDIDIPEQLLECEDEEDIDDIDSYIDGDEEVGEADE
jgi:hypothetical protein